MIYYDAKVELEYALYKPLNLSNDLIIHILARHEFFLLYVWFIYLFSSWWSKHLYQNFIANKLGQIVFITR